jgi:hypothetical protein
MSKESVSHRLLTVSELAKILRVTPGTIYRTNGVGGSDSRRFPD